MHTHTHTHTHTHIHTTHVIFIGLAEVVGGVVMGWVSDHLGRSMAVISGSLIYGGGLALVSLIKYDYITDPQILSIPLAAFAAAFCFGIGDCTFNTQTYAILGQLFGRNEQEAVAAFTIFQFTQNIGSAVGFFYAPHLPLHGDSGTLWPIAIQAIVMECAGILFIVTHLGWNTQRHRPATPQQPQPRASISQNANSQNGHKDDSFDFSSSSDDEVDFRSNIQNQNSDYVVHTPRQKQT